jgi:ABC-type branched-subunit amino acid transport system substrate-binding protein
MLSIPTTWFRTRVWRRLLPTCALLFAFTGGCQAAPPAASGESPTATPQVIEVEVPVEVTRLVVTERIVPVTPTPPQACTPGDLAAAETVTIGALLPLAEPTMLHNTLGTQTALALAVEAINSAGGAGGKPVRVWLADSGGSVEQARAAAIHAVADECAVALVSAAPSDVARAELEVAHGYGVPYLVLDAPDDGLTATGYPEIFRLVPNAGLYAASLAQWVAAVADYNGDGHVQAAAVVEASDAGNGQAERMGAQMEALGIGFEQYPVTLPSDDFSSLIARIVARETMPDALFLRINGDAALLLHRQLVENGIGPQKNTIIVTMRGALNDVTFWQALGPRGGYTVVTRSGPWPGSVDDTGAGFADAFARYLNRWPETQAFAAYDSLFLLADAAGRAQSLAGADLVAALEATDLAGAAGRYRFAYGATARPEESGQPAWAWHQWMDPPLLHLEYTAVDQPSSAMAVLWPPSYATVDVPIVRPSDSQ